MRTEIRVAVIGAGLAGKAHAAAYRTAPTLYNSTLPPVRLVSIADVHGPTAEEVAARFGYDRHDTSWQAIVEADDIDLVSIVVANRLHRQIATELMAAGKHVLCEKPLADSLDDAQAMADAARAASAAGIHARIGLTFLRSPGLAYIHHLVRSGELGKAYHVRASYLCDYALNPRMPISWRDKGAAGSGALADIGSHLSYLAEFVAGSRMTAVRGGAFSTVIAQRPKALGAVVGRGEIQLSDELDTVENDDIANFTADFEGGTTAQLEVSRVAAGHPNSLMLEVNCERGSAAFDFRRPGEVQLFRSDEDPTGNGWRTVQLGPGHPYWLGGLPMDVQGVGIGQNEGFAFQARAMLEEVAGLPEAESLPRNADFDEGLRLMKLLNAVADSARAGGVTISL